MMDAQEAIDGMWAARKSAANFQVLEETAALALQIAGALRKLKQEKAS